MGERCGCGAARVEGLPTCGPCTVVRMRRERDRLARGMFDPRERVLLATLDDRDEEIAALRAERDRMRAVVEAVREPLHLVSGAAERRKCRVCGVVWWAAEPPLHSSACALDILDREEREAAPASGDPELAAAVARLGGETAYVETSWPRGKWRGGVRCGPNGVRHERRGPLRDVLIGLARDASEEPDHG